MSSPLLWRPESISRDMSEMLLMRERAEAATIRDAEWQAFVLGKQRLKQHQLLHPSTDPTITDDVVAVSGTQPPETTTTATTTTTTTTTTHNDRTTDNDEKDPQPFQLSAGQDPADYLQVQGEPEPHSLIGTPPSSSVPGFTTSPTSSPLRLGVVPAAVSPPPPALVASTPMFRNEAVPPSREREVHTPGAHPDGCHPPLDYGSSEQSPVPTTDQCDSTSCVQASTAPLVDSFILDDPIEDQLSHHHETDPSYDSGTSARHSSSKRMRQRSKSNRNDGADGTRKIRRRRMTKEEEARFSAELLKDLKGTTAAKSRKMSASERDVMLHKRRLRNRESAARSRDKQRKTLGDLFEDLDALAATAKALSKRAADAEDSAQKTRDELFKLSTNLDSLTAENESLRREVQRLSAVTPTSFAGGPPRLRRSPSSTLHLSMSSDMLDKLFTCGQNNTLVPASNTGDLAAARFSSGLLRMPSALQLNFSSDKLDSMVFQSLPRNCSFLERLLPESGNCPTFAQTTGSQALPQSAAGKPPLSNPTSNSLDPSF